MNDGKINKTIVVVGGFVLLLMPILILLTECIVMMDIMGLDNALVYFIVVHTNPFIILFHLFLLAVSVIGLVIIVRFFMRKDKL